MRKIRNVFLASLYFLAFLLTSPCLANEFFFEMNQDLIRVWDKELVQLGQASFDQKVFRMDSDFRLGYGDIITVNLWGKVDANYRLEINQSGNVVIPMIGQINVLGKTLNGARELIGSLLDQKYTNVSFDLSLDEIQNIRIKVLGQVKKPGIYTVSAFSKVVEAIANADGPKRDGSLSDIRVLRNGMKVASFNIYEYMVNAQENENVRLRHGDVVFVPKAEKLIAIRGDVLSPGIYDAGGKVHLKQMIDLAGGFQASSFERKIFILRLNPKTLISEIAYEINYPEEGAIDTKDNVEIHNLDTITITTVFDYSPFVKNIFKNVRVTGEVGKPGNYILSSDETLTSLIARAGGINKNGYLPGMVFTRRQLKEKQESMLDEIVRKQKMALLKEQAGLFKLVLSDSEREERQKILLYKQEELELLAARDIVGRLILDTHVIRDEAVDIHLKDGDSIYIPPIPDWVMITGAVYNPTSVAFTEGKTLGFYLSHVGGPTKQADADDIYVINADGCTESKLTSGTKITRGDIIVVPHRIKD